MHLDAWKKEIEQLGSEFSAIDWSYPVSALVVRPPPSPSALQQFVNVSKLEFDSPLCAFYRFADGLAFPDVWNGYFIQELAWVTGRIADQSDIVFGSDGGGGSFSHRRCDGAVMHQISLTPARFIAADFYTFLQRLRDDTHHFVVGTPGWKFIDGLAQ